MLEKALAGGKRYWLWVGFLVVLVGIGFLTYLKQLSFGLGITGMSRDVTWGFYIAQLTFLVGVAASAVMVVLPYYLHNHKVYGRITILGEFLAVAAVAMCPIFVMVDLGQPGRVLNMFRFGQPRSLLFWDTVVLLGYLLLNITIAWTALSYERRGQHPPRWAKFLVYLSIPWAVSIHTVTAFIYNGLGGRPFWLTAILAPRFLASAFAAGPSLLIILCLLVRRYTRFDPGIEAIRSLAKTVTYAMVVNVFFVILEVFTVFYSQMPEHMHSFEYLYVGLHGHNWLAPFMWASIALAILSLVLLLNPRTRNNEKTLVVAAIAVFASLWLEKGLGMVIAGFIPSPLGKITEYAPTAPELAISFGIYGLGFLILTILYKIATSVRESLA